MKRPAIVLLSGGIDSAVVAELTRRFGHPVHALAFDYGQHAARYELAASQEIAAHIGATLRIVDFSALRPLLRGPLVENVRMPNRTLEEIRQEEGPNPNYLPGRNGLFLQMALAIAESEGQRLILVGATGEDQAGFADCRIEYFQQWTELAKRAGVPVEVHAPLAYSPKKEAVRLALDWGLPLHRTWSCYTPVQDGISCGRCDSCILRLESFSECGAEDPLLYAFRP